MLLQLVDSRQTCHEELHDAHSVLALVSYQRVDLALQVFLLRLDGCRYLQAALWPLSVVLV